MNMPQDFSELISAKTKDFLSSGKHNMLVDGKWIEAADGDSFNVFNPANEEVIASVPAARESDVDRAVQAARKALEDGEWARMRPAVRQRLMLKLADLMERDAQILAEIESLDNGKSVEMARAVDVTLAIEFFRFMAGCATKVEGSTLDVSVPFAPPETEFFAYTRREPVGVVAAVVPWNFPLLIAVWKLAPALAAGCTVVLKPAEQTPLSALYLGRLIQEAGFPDGVVNVVTGDGTVGEPLVRHPGINKISFTGSTEVGRLVGKAAMDNMSRVTLELGGKSPMIVLDDYDPSAAAQGAAQAIFFNQGQVCCAGSRLYVHEKQFDRVVGELASIADSLKIGHGFEPGMQLGPLVSREQLDRVCGYIDLGREQGAEVLSGGGRVDRSGYFVKPTVFATSNDSMKIVQEEIFGPVIVAMPYSDLDDIARQANDTPYGLGASIWSNNLSRVQRLIPKIKAGTVWVNCHNMLDCAVPFGGYKLSGFGRDMGRMSMDAYLESKSVFMMI